MFSAFIKQTSFEQSDVYISVSNCNPVPLTQIVHPKSECHTVKYKHYCRGCLPTHCMVLLFLKRVVIFEPYYLGTGSKSTNYVVLVVSKNILITLNFIPYFIVKLTNTILVFHYCERPRVIKTVQDS